MERKSDIRKPRVTTGRTASKGPISMPAVIASAAASKGDDVYDRIRQRAYELYEERGRRDGFDEEDWLRAEAELLTRSLTRSA